MTSETVQTVHTKLLKYCLKNEVVRLVEQERTTIAKARFIESFRTYAGIITIACQDAGVGRTTYYEWRQKDKEFAKEIDTILSQQASVVEDRLLKLIHQDNAAAIMFYLRSKHPDYTPKLKTTMVDERTLEDLLKEDDAKYAQEIEQPADTTAALGTGQAGQEGKNEAEPSPAIVVYETDTPQPDTESKTKGN